METAGDGDVTVKAARHGDDTVETAGDGNVTVKTARHVDVTEIEIRHPRHPTVIPAKQIT